MPITVDFSPQEEARITTAARAEGTDRATIRKNLVHTYLPLPEDFREATPDEKRQKLIDTFRAWREEDATDDEEEWERRDVETQQLLQNLAANRLSLRVPEL
jgi:hypothetical protein